VDSGFECFKLCCLTVPDINAKHVVQIEESISRRATILADEVLMQPGTYLVASTGVKWLLVEVYEEIDPRYVTNALKTTHLDIQLLWAQPFGRERESLRLLSGRL
jgi:hypothetical protein